MSRITELIFEELLFEQLTAEPEDLAFDTDRDRDDAGAGGVPPSAARSNVEREAE